MIMKKELSRYTQVFNWIGAALMVILVVLQFLPFWNYGEGIKSINSYVWFTSKCGDLEDYLIETTGFAGEGYFVNSMVLMPILVLIIAVVGVVVCVLKSDEFAAAVAPIACGLVGAWGYLTKPAYQLGTNWVLHLAVCAVMLIIGVVSLIIGIKDATAGETLEPQQA